MANTVLVRREDGIAIVTLNRPAALNALDAEMLRAFIAAMQFLNADDYVEAIVLTGAGERAFSAGQDLAMSAELTAETVGPWFRRVGAIYQSVRELDKPSVVALNGVAAGFGFQIALHADIRVAHPDVRMSQPEIAAGIPSIVGMWIMTEVLGAARAREMSLTCRFVPADECLAWGLVNEVVPREQVLPRALEIAADLAAKPKVAMRLSKRRMRELTQPAYDETIEAAVRIQTEAYATGEPQRTAAAFLASRVTRLQR